MKKKLSMLLIFVLATGIFTSCANISTTTKLDDSLQPTEKTYTVLEAGASSDSSLGINHSREILLDSKKVKDDAKKNLSKEVNIDNKTISGKYDETGISPYYNRNFDTYKSMSDGVRIEFFLNSETGKMVGYSTYDETYLEKNGTKKILSEEECIEIAENHLKNYVSDIENYKITSKRFSNSSVYNGRYMITFSRYINGIETLDGALITVTQYGDITSFDFNNLGDMKGATVLNNLDFEAIEKAVDEKCEKIYGDIMNDPNYSVNISKSKRLVRMADGKYALEYDIYADIADVNSDRHTGDMCELTVYL